ncbi:hypothetical protein Leryth_011282 [Lithospermum erythrorhizon]|nr:hypothetical protein Leryth_011282 [Lithospermum erythrorhizon]
MAKSCVQRRLLRDLPYAFRSLSTAPSPSISTAFSLTNRVESDVIKQLNNINETSIPTTTLNLEDGKELFSSVSSTKLLRSSLTLQMATFEPMVDIGTWVMNSNLMQVPIFKKMVFKIVENTFYEHFCAGQDVEAVGRTALKLRESGLKGMLDYGLEHVDDNESCDQNFKQFLQTIESTKSLPKSSVSFVVAKITAICPMSLLKRVSDQLRWEAKDSSTHLPWKQRTLPIFSDISPLYHTQKKPSPLTLEEERDLNRAHERLQKLCEACVEANVPLLVDAEDTIVQPAIDYLNYWAAIKYHKDDEPIVFGTIQAYLKDAKERMIQTKIAAEKIGVPMGFKLVRGAYMSSENKEAASLGFDSPIFDSLDQTHSCYNNCASFMLEKVADGSGAIVLATHNVDSAKLAAAKAIELGIEKGNNKLQFAQLYGMSEVLSFALRNAGFQVSKYLPFGNVELIMPYLLRRAEENRGLLSTSILDRQLMRKELVRRIKSLEFNKS